MAKNNNIFIIIGIIILALFMFGDKKESIPTENFLKTGISYESVAWIDRTGNQEYWNDIETPCTGCGLSTCNYKTETECYLRSERDATLVPLGYSGFQELWKTGLGSNGQTSKFFISATLCPIGKTKVKQYGSIGSGDGGTLAETYGHESPVCVEIITGYDGLFATTPIQACSKDTDCSSGLCGRWLMSECMCYDTTWTPSDSEVCLGTSFTQSSNCGTLRNSTGTKSCTIPCVDTTWLPSESTVCTGDTFTQTSNCDNTKSATGTKSCGTSCTDSIWLPSPSTVCSGTSFTQSSNCGNTKLATGTKDCSTPCTDTAWTPATSTVCNGQDFSQISNCGNSRTATGSKSCVTSNPYTPTTTSSTTETSCQFYQDFNEGKCGTAIWVWIAGIVAIGLGIMTFKKKR